MEELEEILVNDLEHCSFYDLCKGVRRQRELQAAKSFSLEKFKEVFEYDDPEEAKRIYEAIQKSKEGYLRITRLSPSPKEPEEGWSFVFGEGLSLHLDRPDRWYSTSVIQKIDWEAGTFTTLNSVYKFEFIDKDAPIEIR